MAGGEQAGKSVVASLFLIRKYFELMAVRSGEGSAGVTKPDDKARPQRPPLYWLVGATYGETQREFRYLEEWFGALNMLVESTKGVDPGFLERMDGLTPWGQLEERIRPFYPKAGRARRPYESESNKRPTGDEKRETPIVGVFPLAVSSSLKESGDPPLRCLRFSDRRQQDVKQPHLGGEVEQGDEVSRVRLCPSLPPPHTARAHAETAGQPPPRQPRSLPEPLQTIRKVRREPGRFHVIDPLLRAAHVATPRPSSARRPPAPSP